MTRARRAAALAAVFALGVGACSPVAGVPVAARALDVGPYQTTAVAVTGRPGIGIVLEGQRMAAGVVVPSEVDDTLRRLESTNTGPVPDAQGLRADIRARRAAIAEAHFFVAGFSSSRSTESESTPTTSVVNLVMRFPDAGAASAAAREMAAAEPTRPTAITHHRETMALVVTMPRGVIVESFTPRGPYVLYQWVQTRNTLEAATGMVAGILDLQGPRIDAFTPTDPARLAELPVDPTGLMSHTLRQSSGRRDPAVGVYSGPGALHFERDPMRAADAFTAAAATAVALGLTTVYQAESSTGATRLIDRFTAEEMSAGATATDSVVGVPDATCIDRGGGPVSPSRYTCHGTNGRYAFATTSGYLRDAHQQAAAQYLLLSGF